MNIAKFLRTAYFIEHLWWLLLVIASQNNVVENVSVFRKTQITFPDSDSFIIAYHISLVNVQTKYCNNILLILDVKQLHKIMTFFLYFYTLKLIQLE